MSAKKTGTAAKDDAAAEESATAKPAGAQPITVSRIVHYRLTEADAAACDGMLGRRNVLKAGDVYPAIATRVHGADCADLRVFVGPSDRFHSSVMLGEAEGTWSWPPRA